MGAPLPWLALTAAVTAINGLTLRYLAGRERSAACGFWSRAWLAWAAATVPLMLLEQSPPFSPPFLALGLLWVASAIQFLHGSYALVGKPVPRAWYGIAVAAAVTALALALVVRQPLAMAPLALFQCCGLVGAGVVVVAKARGHAGAWLYGSALLLLGLHVLDAPLVMRFPQLVPWGFSLALSLEVLAALGMVVLHYEQARLQLVVAERTLERARRAEALGRVAGGVAHDFNNMLMVLGAHLDSLRSEEAPTTAVEEAIGGIDEVVQRGSRLTRQLLVFGRRAEAQRAPLDVRELVQSTLELLEKVVPKRIALQFRCENGEYHALLDRSLLEQIMLNLVTNARDAIDGAGTISVELEPSADQSRIVLRVSDDGVGMDDAVVRRIFEPFFTTKGDERGTGLGLASVEAAVTRLGGTIGVTSAPGVGTRFEVTLPRR
jgi:signal transduction histidine kinase